MESLLCPLPLQSRLPMVSSFSVRLSFWTCIGQFSLVPFLPLSRSYHYSIMIWFWVWNGWRGSHPCRFTGLTSGHSYLIKAHWSDFRVICHLILKLLCLKFVCFQQSLISMISLRLFRPFWINTALSLLNHRVFHLLELVIMSFHLPWGLNHLCDPLKVLPTTQNWNWDSSVQGVARRNYQAKH